MLFSLDFFSQKAEISVGLLRLQTVNFAMAIEFVFIFVHGIDMVVREMYILFSTPVYI